MSKQGYGAGTHTGQVRQHNEDCYGADPEAGLWLIADGMGGHQAGEVASAVVVKSILATTRQSISVTEAVAHSHQAILNVLKEGRGARGMGSTVVVLKMNGNDYEIAWIGDSRAYLCAEGSLHQLTQDHTVIRYLLEAGIIDTGQARVHPQRNQLTQALGATEIAKMKIETVSGTLHPGEQILLCSDGLTNELSEEQITAILSRDFSVQRKVDQLIQAALDAGGNDNITVLLIPNREKAIAVDTDDTQPVPIAQIADDTEPLSIFTDAPSSRQVGLWSTILLITVVCLFLIAWWLSLR